MRKLHILQHIDREGPSLFLTVANAIGIDTSILRVDKGDVIPPLNNETCLLILGGPMGINDLKNDKYSWLNYELKIIKECLKAKIPMIGVCLGAQLIAYAAGGGITQVKFGDPPIARSEIGWSGITFNVPSYMCNTPFYGYKYLDVLHWHTDRIILPKESILLASSKKCKEQFFLMPNNVYGLQFHVEITQGDFLRWLEEDIQFVKREYGADAKSILLANSEKYVNENKIERISFIRTLLELTCL
tara:strand:+ start:756 stop:1490 length:735 start_codon:yes stop_codon:yes gene_type:complete